MKRSLLLLLLIAMLSSCVAVVLAGAAAGVIVYDRRSLTTIEADARIDHLIHQQLVKNPATHNAHIEVASFNRTVLLVGEANQDAIKHIAGRMAANTSDVRRVYNEIRIVHPLSLSRHSKDLFLTGQIKTRMLAQKGLESGSIKIVTEDAIVYLMGIVTPEEANMAVEIARHNPGVLKVVKLFQYY